LKQRPRVLHVISILSVGGVEMWLISLLRHIRTLPDDADVETFDVLMTGGERSELDDLAASLGANLHYIPFGRRNSRQFVQAFRRLLKDREYSAIHDHQDYAAGWHFLAGAGLLPRVRIVHVHSAISRLRESANTRLRRAGLVFSRKILARYATDILGTSSVALEEYGFNHDDFPNQNIQRLHCGFDPAPFEQSPSEARESVRGELGWPGGSRIVLFVGRLDGSDPANPGVNPKNPQFALEIAKHAVAKNPAVRFVFLGGGAGDVLEVLKKQVERLGLSDQVKLLGPRLEVARFMAASTCLIFPSLGEGLGMVAVEAQAAGVRVLASDTVPRECVVVRERVSFKSLADGAAAWADDVLEMLKLPSADRQAASEAVRNSSFSIQQSYAALHRIYSRAS
jgi:glycosyltransferase involved in cell wall biosynthesis